MQTFLAVLKELWDFVFAKQAAPSQISQVTNNILNLPPALKDLPALALPVVERKLELPNESSALGMQGEKAYISVSQAKVFTRPVLSYDGVIQRLPYSNPVSVVGYEGRFARILLNDKSGWVLKDEITSDYSDIYPDFQVGEIYSLKHPDTVKLRKLIKDEFFAAEMFLPLQEVEFVLFRLLTQGRQIVWPSMRPRTPGNWQNILKGKLGVQIGIFPKTGSLIEYSKPDGTGWIGYTKSVRADETIVVEGVGRLIEGEYREESFTKAQWQEWRPVWISIV